MGKKGKDAAKSNNKSGKGGISKHASHAQTVPKFNNKERKRGGGDKVYKANWNRFCDQLKITELTLRSTTSDGNCLFRALSDQFHGHQAFHSELRAAVCSYLLSHADDFAPFCEDSDFLHYCRQLAKDGTWAGHLELSAISRLYGVDVVVHQLGAPRLEIRHQLHAASSSSSSVPVKTIHFSYHDGEHYSSVRKLTDDTNGPAVHDPLPVRISSSSSSSSSSSKNNSGSLSENVRIIRASTGCMDESLIRSTLLDTWNDLDAATEIVMATMLALQSSTSDGDFNDAGVHSGHGDDKAESEAAAGDCDEEECKDEEEEYHADAAASTPRRTHDVSIHTSTSPVTSTTTTPASSTTATTATTTTTTTTVAATTSSTTTLNGNEKDEDGASSAILSSFASSSSSSSSSKAVISSSSSSSSLSSLSTHQSSVAKSIGLKEPCPCGSGKKYKKCCHAAIAAALSSSSSSSSSKQSNSNSTCLSNKQRKQAAQAIKKQSKFSSKHNNNTGNDDSESGKAVDEFGALQI